VLLKYAWLKLDSSRDYPKIDLEIILTVVKRKSNLSIIRLSLERLQVGMDVSVLFASKFFCSRAIILVLSMAEYLVEVPNAMNSSCVKGSEGASPKQAPS
jgi:hypothetical protein